MTAEHQQRLAYLAFPKTASRWVVYAIKRLNLGNQIQVLPGHDISNKWRLKQDSTFIMTNIREPAQWLRSYYFWTMSMVKSTGTINAIAAPTSILMPMLCDEVNQFYRNVLDMPGTLDAIYNAYNWLADATMKTETINESFPAMLKFCRIEAGLIETLKSSPPVNVTKMEQPEIPAWVHQELRATNPNSYSIWENAQ